jgi:hypothetical protein
MIMNVSSNPLVVYAPKDFPGMVASSELSVKVWLSF